MKEMGQELNEAIRRSRKVGRGSARSARPNYMWIPTLGLEPPAETAGEDKEAEDVEVGIAPGFSAADLESAEVSEPGQMAGNINEAEVETQEVESTTEVPVMSHKEPVNGEGGAALQDGMEISLPEGLQDLNVSPGHAKVGDGGGSNLGLKNLAQTHKQKMNLARKVKEGGGKTPPPKPNYAKVTAGGGGRYSGGEE